MHEIKTAGLMPSTPGVANVHINQRAYAHKTKKSVDPRKHTYTNVRYALCKIYKNLCTT